MSGLDPTRRQQLSGFLAGNGLGSSREVAREDADGRLCWMVSLTTIMRDSPFSDYRGYDRLGTFKPVAMPGGAPPSRARL